MTLPIRFPALLAVTLSACVVAPPPRPVVVAPPIPSMVARPGAGKDRAAFDADNRLCQRTARIPYGDNIYAQCMISHGEVVEATPYFYAPPLPYGLPYGYATAPY